MAPPTTSAYIAPLMTALYMGQTTQVLSAEWQVGGLLQVFGLSRTRFDSIRDRDYTVTPVSYTTRGGSPWAGRDMD